MYKDYWAFRKDAYKLKGYAKLCGDELGEYWESLANLACRTPELMSDEFMDALQKEVHDELENIEANARVVEHNETREVTNTYKELIWDNE